MDRESVARYRKRREDRLRARLNAEKDPVARYYLLKAIYKNRWSNRLSQNEDGGPGSGNHNHEGRPGDIGGSLPSGSSFNDRMKDAFNFKAKGKDYTEVGSEMRRVLKDMHAGSKVKIKGKEYEKTGDGQFKYKFKGRDATTTMNAVANAVDPFDESTMPEFEKPKAESVAQAKIESGQMKPSETDVKIPAMEPEEYKGGQVVDVSKQQFQSLREELQKNTGKAVLNDEVKEYLDAIDAYRGTDYTDVVAASAGFSDGYERYGKQMSDETRAKAVAQADTMERFISSADKYEGKVMRALGFDLGGDFDDGSTTQQFEALISRCKPGEQIDMGHISSWSTDQSAIKQILSARTGTDDTAERSVQVVFTCPKSKSGVDIGRFSKDFTQGEVAFSKDQKFVVKSVKQKEVGDDDWPITKYEIEVDEA